MQYDLFISYARKDNIPTFEGKPGYITSFIEGLKREHRRFGGENLKIFFDKDDIRDGDDWEIKIDASLRSSALLIACLSPNYFHSLWCRNEWEAYSFHEADRAVGGEGINPIYFIEVPGFEQGSVEEKIDHWVQALNKRNHTDLRPWSPFGIEALEMEDVRKRLELLDSQINSRLQRINRALQAPGNVDRQAQVFVGRQKEIHRLRHILSGKGTVGVITAVQGLGGIGKTAMANQYAHAYAGEYPGGRWVLRCEGIDDLPTAMLQLVTPLEIELKEAEKKDTQLALKRILNELQERTLKHISDELPNPAALLIFDNVDKPALISPQQSALLPKAEWLHIIATTRMGPEQLFEKQKDRQFISLDELDEDDGVLLIKKYQPDEVFPSAEDAQAARQIVLRLGGFTLAIESVAVYLGVYPEITCADFLSRLEEEGIDAQDTISLEDDVSGYIMHREKSLTAVLTPLLASLSEEERYVTDLAAHLPADAIPLPWLKALAGEKYPALTEVKRGHPDPWDQTVRRLLGRKILQSTSDTDSDGKPRIVKMHRLIGEFLRKRSEDTESFRKALFDFSLTRSDYLEKHWHRRSEQWEIAPMFRYADLLLEERYSNAPKLVKWLGQWLLYIFSATSYIELHLRALDILRVANEAEQTETAIMYSNLGVVFEWLGEFGKARSYLHKAIEIDEKYRDPDHQFLAIRYDNLAIVERRFGNLEEAKRLHLKALAIREKVFEPDHPDLALSYGNLAGVETEMGNHEEAKRLYLKAQAIREKVFDPDHPSIASSYNGLATVEYAKGNLEEAKRLSLKALAIREKVFEPDHPDIALNYHNLASVEQALGNQSEAESLFRKAIKIREAKLPKGHKDTQTSRKMLADLLDKLGRSEEAEVYRLKILESESESMTSEDLRSRSKVYLDLGDYEKAESILHRLSDQGFELPGTYCHLARICILTNRIDSARDYIAAATDHIDGAKKYILARITWFQIFFALLEGEEIKSYIRQLKLTLQDDRAFMEWTMQPVMDAINVKVTEREHTFLSTLVDALSDKKKLSKLNKFAEWREIE